MAFSFKPVKPLRVAEEIAQQLKQSIVLGHFGVGDKLPNEADLADQFQVSRTAVRDAVRILKSSGFVLTRQGASGGAYVTNLTFERLAGAFLDLFQAEKTSLVEVFDVRCLLEPEVARRAAERINPETARRLKESMETAPHFHLALAEMCGNRLLECLVRSTVDLAGRIKSIEADGVRALSSHQQILEAVLSGNGGAAAEAMHRHNIEAMESLKKSAFTSTSAVKRFRKPGKS